VAQAVHPDVEGSRSSMGRLWAVGGTDGARVEHARPTRGAAGHWLMCSLHVTERARARGSVGRDVECRCARGPTALVEPEPQRGTKEPPFDHCTNHAGAQDPRLQERQVDAT